MNNTTPYPHNNTYIKQLRNEVLVFSNTYYYDGPYSERILIDEFMTRGNGQLNPHQVISFVREFLSQDEYPDFNYYDTDFAYEILKY